MIGGQYLDRDVNRLDLDVAHAGQRVGDPLLHRRRHLRGGAAVLDRELQLGAGAAALEHAIPSAWHACESVGDGSPSRSRA